MRGGDVGGAVGGVALDRGVGGDARTRRVRVARERFESFEASNALRTRRGAHAARGALRGREHGGVEEAHRAATKQQKGLEKQLADISDALARATAEQQEAESRGEVEMNKRQRDEYSRLKGEAGAKSASLHERRFIH